MFRPQRTTVVLLAIVAEPVEKPDARLLALDSHNAPTPVSQPVSLDHRETETRIARHFALDTAADQIAQLVRNFMK